MIILNDKKWNGTIYKRRGENDSTVYLDNERILINEQLKYDTANLIIKVFNEQTYHIVKVDSDLYKFYKEAVNDFVKNKISFRELVATMHSEYSSLIEVKKTETYLEYLAYRLKLMRGQTIDVTPEIDVILNSNKMRVLMKHEFETLLKTEEDTRQFNIRLKKTLEEQEKLKQRQQQEVLSAYDLTAIIIYASRKSDFLDKLVDFYKEHDIKKTKKELTIYWKGAGEYVISTNDIVTKEEFDSKIAQ